MHYAAVLGVCMPTTISRGPFLGKGRSRSHLKVYQGQRSIPFVSRSISWRYPTIASSPTFRSTPEASRERQRASSHARPKDPSSSIGHIDPLITITSTQRWRVQLATSSTHPSHAQLWARVRPRLHFLLRLPVSPLRPTPLPLCLLIQTLLSLHTLWPRRPPHQPPPRKHPGFMPTTHHSISVRTVNVNSPSSSLVKILIRTGRYSRPEHLQVRENTV